MKKQESGQLKRRLSWSNVNGLFIVAAVLGGTILLTGATEARLQKAEAELIKTQPATELAHCPIGQYFKTSVVR